MNHNTPWNEEGISELEYWKKRLIETSHEFLASEAQLSAYEIKLALVEAQTLELFGMVNRAEANMRQQTRLLNDKLKIAKEALGVLDLLIPELEKPDANIDDIRQYTNEIYEARVSLAKIWSEP